MNRNLFEFPHSSPAVSMLCVWVWVCVCVCVCVCVSQAEGHAGAPQFVCPGDLSLQNHEACKAEEGKVIKAAQAQAERCDTAKDKGPRKEHEADCARRPDRQADS
ncbi:hypothetical protein AMECASPLE_016338 [Ameca splendens]|uniref:Secreted protein n=1 Tax=Ameca splendens TaxID=208324 RepID=A0ABV0XF72_9TELE